MTKCLTGKTHHLQQTWTEQQIWIRLFDILVWRQHAWRAAEATQMAFCHHLTLYLPHNFISDLTSSKKHEGLWHQKHVCLCLSAVLNPKTFAAFLKKIVMEMMKQNETKQTKKVQLWCHIYFNLHKICGSEETYRRPNQDYWGVCCFMALFGTILSGRLNTKLYCRQLPRATFCFKTIKGKNKLPFSVWSKTQHKKCQEDLKCQFLYSQCVYLGLLPVWEQDGLLFLFSF